VPNWSIVRSMELVDQRVCCSSAKMVTCECRECKYTYIYNLNSTVVETVVMLINGYS